jgi:uncharacterized membrane protein
MTFEHTATIDAPAEVVWAVYRDVTRWPEWTASVRSVELLGADELALGARARIRQPRLPTVVWEVTELDAGRSWTWTARSPGATTHALHLVRPLADGRTEVTQRIDQRGPLGQLASLVLARTTRRYLAMEAAGLAARCEAQVASGRPG